MALVRSLAGNSLDTKAAEHLSEALKTNSTLQTLNLINNNISPEGANHLSETLKTNSALQTLDLRDNNIDKSAKELLRNVAVVCALGPRSLA